MAFRLRAYLSLLAISLIAVVPRILAGDSSGPNVPSSCTDDNSFLGAAWSNPSNAQTDNGTGATATLPPDERSDYLNCQNYGFAITSSSIDGIVVTVDRKATGTDISVDDERVRLVKGGVVGTTDKQTNTAWPTTYADATYGSSSDLWGDTWSEANIEATNFGAVVSAFNSDLVSGTATVDIDVIEITVHYTGGITVSGTVYSDEGSTALGNQTVRVAVNGTDHSTTAESNASTGAYSISGVSAVANDVITVYLEDETADAVTATVTDGANETGIDLYQDRLITRHDNSGSLTNSNLSTAAVASEADISNIYSVSAGALTVADGKELFVPTSHTFAPGGAVTVDDIDINGTFTMSSNAVAVSGTWDGTGGSFSSTGTVTFDAASGTEDIFSDGDAFNHLTLNDGGGTATFELEDALDVNGNLTITGGTLDTKSGENNSINLAGNWSNSDTFTEQSGTVTFDGSGAQTLGGETFYNLTINNSAASPDDSTDVDSSAAVTVTNTLTVTDGQFQPTTASDFAAVTIGASGILKPDASAAVTVSGNWSNSGTFTNNSGTVTFDGTGSQTVTGDTFNNLTINNSAASPDDDTDVDAAAVTVSATLTVTDGQFQPATSSDFNGAVTISTNGILKPDSSASITVAGAWTNSGTFTNNSGTVTFDGTSGTIDITSGGSAFNHLTLNDGGGTATFELEDALDVNGNLTITGGTLDTKSGENNSINLAGNWSNSDIFTARSGTVTIDGTSQSIAGSSDTTFYNFTKSVSSADTLTFDDARTTTISNNPTMKGVSGNLLSLRSDAAGTQFEIDVSSSGTRDIEYVDVQDSNNTNATAVDCSTGCVNSGNNTGWTFPASAGGGGGDGGESDSASDTVSDPLDPAGDRAQEIASALMLEQGVVDANNQRIITVAVGRPIAVTSRPVEADRLVSLTLRIGDKTYQLKPHPNNLFVYTVTIDAFTISGFKPYTLTADYGITTRTEKGLILVYDLTSPAEVELPAPSLPVATQPSSLTPVIELGEPVITSVGEEPGEQDQAPVLTRQEPRTSFGIGPSLASVVSHSLSDIAGQVTNFLAQTNRRGLAFAQSLGQWLAKAGVGVGRISLSLARAVGSSMLVSVRTTLDTVIGVSELAPSSGQSLGSSLSFSWRSALIEAQQATRSSWEVAEQSFGAVIEEVFVASQELTKSSVAFDPRIPTHLRGHVYKEILVQLSDNEGQPLAGALVTLASEPQTRVSDRQGQAVFENIPVGEHKLTIAFGKYQARQSLLLNQDADTVAVAFQGTFREGVGLAWWVGGMMAAAAIAGWLAWKVAWTITQRRASQLS
jgi:hypothetical protein